MTEHDHYEEQTRRLLAEAQSELKAAEGELDILKDRITLLIREVQAYQIALQSYFRRRGTDVSFEPAWNELLKDAQSHKDRIKAIARQQGGRIKVGEVTDILYTKGFIRAKKRATAYAMVQSNLADLAAAGDFQKVAPGEYVLLDTQQGLPHAAASARQPREDNT